MSPARGFLHPKCPFPGRSPPCPEATPGSGACGKWERNSEEEGESRLQPLTPTPKHTGPKEGLALGWGGLTQPLALLTDPKSAGKPAGKAVPRGTRGQWARGLGCVDAFPSHGSRGDETDELRENHTTWSLCFGGGWVLLKVTEAPACAGVG